MEVIKIHPGRADYQEQEAGILKKELADNNVLYINVLSAPGAGKTTVLLKVLEKLKDTFECGVLEADVDSQKDAVRFEEAGYKTVQLYTDTPGLLDAQMSRQGLEALGLENIDIAFMEGAGTPVSSKDVDSGAHGDILIFSVPEGVDKPQKYPLLFQNCDLLLINKIDVLPYFDFDLEKFKASVRMLNPNVPILEVSARQGRGIEEAAEWICHKYRTLQV